LWEGTALARHREFTDALLRLFLRSIPFFPAPEAFDLILSVRRSERDFDKQIREAFDALGKSSTLIENLGEALKEREAKLKTLQSEYERISQLASLTTAQAQAVATSLQNVLGQSARRERIYGFLINLAAGIILFVVGVFASDRVKGLFH
jgi:hypothetical protein